MACPDCAEDHRIIRRNRATLTNAFHLYSDLARLASEMSPGKPDDACALRGAENFFNSVARSNSAYFSVDLCECRGCGICYVDHPFKPDQVKRYYASPARAYEIGGKAIFSRAHAYDWVKTKARRLPICAAASANRSPVCPFSTRDVLKGLCVP